MGNQNSQEKESQSSTDGEFQTKPNSRKRLLTNTVKTINQYRVIVADATKTESGAYSESHSEEEIDCKAKLIAQKYTEGILANNCVDAKANSKNKADQKN